MHYSGIVCSLVHLQTSQNPNYTFFKELFGERASVRHTSAISATPATSLPKISRLCIVHRAS